MTPNQLSVAYTSGGVCQHCRKALILPGQTPKDLFWETGNKEAIARPRCYQCRVVPLNRNKTDHSIRNLKLFCPSCASRFWAMTRKKRIRFATRRRARHAT